MAAYSSGRVENNGLPSPRVMKGVRGSVNLIHGIRPRTLCLIQHISRAIQRVISAARCGQVRAGRVYVADQTNRRVQIFDRSGTFLLKWGQCLPGQVHRFHHMGLFVGSQRACTRAL
jgi:hypothetical protein